MRDKQRTREDSATQPLDAGRLSFANKLAMRSRMLRAVAKLVVISDRRDNNIEMVEKHFDVIRMDDANEME